ncbi:MAG: hypothetical protein ACKVVP_17160 [Chloroflexota bacterium]
MVERVDRLDFELLLDRLDDVISTASRVPFGARVMVDQADCASIIQMMRESLPAELNQARQTLDERDSILEHARIESERLIEQAHLQASHEALQHEIVREAKLHAAEIEQSAELDAQRVREEMDEYARQVLQRLTSRIETTLRALKTGTLELERHNSPSERRAEDDTPAHLPSERRHRSPRTMQLEAYGEPP